MDQGLSPQGSTNSGKLMSPRQVLTHQSRTFDLHLIPSFLGGFLSTYYAPG